MNSMTQTKPGVDVSTLPILGTLGLSAIISHTTDRVAIGSAYSVL
jgi:hypothetical protein